MLGAVPCRLWLLLVVVIVCPSETEAESINCTSPTFLDSTGMSCLYQCPKYLVGDHITGRCETFDVARDHYSTKAGAYRTISSTLVAFNATKYTAVIARNIAVGTVVMSAGLAMNWTGETETYSIATPRGVSGQPPAPYDIQHDGQNRGQIYIPKEIVSSQIVDTPYRSVITCRLPEGVSITADLEIQVVNMLDPCAGRTSGCEQKCIPLSNSYNCSCRKGYTLNADGHGCDDIDECLTREHNCSQNCSNTPGSFVCKCRDGYSLQGDGSTCADVNECQTGEHNCSHNCSNTLGSFECKCRAGYSLDLDGSSCSDVDECQSGGHDCSQLCGNVPGSFVCRCRAGYSLQGDGITCEDIDECQTSEHNCSQTCSNTPGFFVCKCMAGYSLQGDGTTCEDVDECESGEHNCSQLCDNVPGSFECKCRAGYYLELDGSTCRDVDECGRKEHNCSQLCDNVPGSFECKCRDGYSLQGDGTTCADVDECQTEEHNCSHNCSNIVGSFECNCSAGYSLDLDGSTCTDIDECESGEDNCDQLCDNVPGSFVCRCKAGYSLQGDGATCEDINECETGKHNCSQTCSNSPGSFECNCTAGYSLDLDGSTCTDIDECQSGGHNCSQLCDNVPGSFECKCRAGYSLDLDGSTCTDVDECGRKEHNCSQLCDNVPGSFECRCKAGYSLQDDGTTCTDVDECQTGEHNCNQTCSNTRGSFVCKCRGGYSLDLDGSTCTDLRDPENIKNLANKLTALDLTADNVDQLLALSLDVAESLNSAVNNVNRDNLEVTEDLIDAVASVLSDIIYIRNESRHRFKVSLSDDEEEELNAALVGTLGQVLSQKFLSSLIGDNETNQESEAVTNFVSVAEDVGLSVASSLRQEQPSKNYTSGNLNLQVGLTSNSTFHANIGEDASVSLSAASTASNTGKPLAVVTMALGPIGKYFPSNSTVLGEVVSIQLTNPDLSSAERLRNNESAVQISFPTIEDSDNVTCGFYRFQTMDSPAAWSTEGVVKGNCSSGVCCHSNHLTNFAVLVNIGGVKHDDAIERGLQWLSYIGCGLSIICLLITIVALSVFRCKGQKTPLNFVHLNLSVVLFLALCLFVGGGWYLREYKIPCAIVAGLLHYLFLAVFSWMLCEGVMLYLMLVKVFTRLPERLWFFALLGYGIPILPVVVTAGARYDYYGSKDFGCWLSPRLEDRTIWGFAVPAAMIIIVNTVFLVLVVVQLCKSQKSSVARDTSNIKVAASAVKATVLLLPILGLSWIFGYVSIPTVAPELTLVFQVIFIVLNSLQGVAIFVFYVLRNEKLLPLWQKCCPCCMKPKTDSTSHSTKRSNTLQMGTFSMQQAVDTKEADLDHFSLKSKGEGSSITDMVQQDANGLHSNGGHPSATYAEEQTVAVAFSGADNVSITDCEFHIKEAVVSSSVAIQCEENSSFE